MTIRSRLLALTLGFALTPSLAVAATLDGTYWLTEAGDAVIGFLPCPSGTCGKIVTLAKATNEQGKPLTDANNPDPAKRKKPIIGLTTIFDITPAAAGQWNAMSYDPRKGEEREITIELRGQGKLVVTGCGLGGLICRSFTWTKAPPPAQTQ